jgi:uncharacterized integral membrane protein (TIGR00697 family)
MEKRMTVMFNLLWGALFMIVNFVLLVGCYRLFGKKGLFAWVCLATILANLQVVKTIELVGIVATLGNTIYLTIYMATDMLNEKYGEREARSAVWLGFYALLTVTVTMQMALVFQPQPEDVAQGHLEALFGFLPQLALASLSAFLVSQFLDVKLFSWLKRKYQDKFWIRTNGSTLISQLVDTLVFCTIAFATMYPFEIWIQIFISTYLLKLLLSILSTPVMYWMRSLKVRE